MSERKAEAVAARYRSHLASLLPTLPEPVRRFVTTVNIHDGLLRQATLDCAARTLTLELRCGDVPHGYFDLTLHYNGVDVARRDRGALAAIAQNVMAEALYHEFDRVEGERFVHRWLWWPYREFDVSFTGLQFETMERSDRTWSRSMPTYRELGGSAT